MDEKYYTFDEETKTLIIKEPIINIGYAENNCFELYVEDAVTYTDIKDFDVFMKKVKFPVTIELIGLGAFSNWRELKVIEFDSNAEDVMIGRSCFEHCSNLKIIKWNKSKILCIHHYAFWGCKSLKEIQIPKSLEVIGEEIFGKCENLEKIYVPKKIKENFCNLDSILTSGNNAKIVIVEDDFDLYENDSNSEQILKKEAQKTKVSFSKNNSYCGCMRENLLKNKQKIQR